MPSERGRRVAQSPVRGEGGSRFLFIFGGAGRAGSSPHTGQADRPCRSTVGLGHDQARAGPAGVARKGRRAAGSEAHLRGDGADGAGREKSCWKVGGCSVAD